MNIHLIGNERKENKDLLDIARKNPTINDVLEGKKEKSVIGDAKYYEKAKQLVENTEKYFGYNKDGLIINTTSEKSIVFLTDTALLAVDKILLGYAITGKELIDKIEKYYDYDEESLLIKNGDSIFTSDSLAIAIARHFLGDSEELKKVLDDVEEYIGYNHQNSLFPSEIREHHYTTADNSLISIAYSLSGDYKKARLIIDIIAKEIDFYENVGLIEEAIKDFETDNAILLSSYSNSLYAIAKNMSAIYKKEREEASKFIKSIEQRIGFSPSEGIVRKAIGSNTVEHSTDSIALAFAYLTLGGALDKYKKK
jgi:hypothetical protein